MSLHNFIISVLQNNILSQKNTKTSKNVDNNGIYENCYICQFKYLLGNLININDYKICTKCLESFNRKNIMTNIYDCSIDEILESISSQKSVYIIRLEKNLERSRIEREENKKNNNNVYQTCFSNLKYIEPIVSENKEPKRLLKDMPELKFSNITSRTSLDTINTFIVIDTETTGLSASSDELIEISAIKFIDSEPKECLTTLLKPKNPISKEIESINHITNEMVQNSPSVEYVINDFSSFIKGFNIVGYNLEFDIKFLYRNGVDFFSEKRRFYDVLPLCRRTLKDDFLPDYKLDTICSHLGIKRTNAHRSTEDALATGILFRDIGQSKRIIV